MSPGRGYSDFLFIFGGLHVYGHRAWQFNYKLLEKSYFATSNTSYRTIHHWECLIVLDDDCAAATATTTTPLASHLVRLLLAHTRAARLVVACVPPFRVSVEVGFVPAHVVVRELPIHDALNLVHQIAPRLRTDEAVQLVRKCR